MEKLHLQTPDFVAANAARLGELFPNCVTETRDPKTGEIKRAIDFDLLRQELSYDLVEGPQERYRLDWPGKREALALANAPIRKTLRPCKNESVDFDTTQNLYIEGDNLDALKLLQETYLGKVKMIYIDPPYNIGNDFIYDDDFSISGKKHDLLSGTMDEEGNAMFNEEKWKQNASSNGKFHSEWLSMMYPRLKLAKNLLREDGVVFISIDDNEVHNLRKICDEVFGVQNFVAEVAWKNKYGAGAKTRTFIEVHEYILCYSRSPLEDIQSPITPEQYAEFENKKDEKYQTRGGYVTQPIMTNSLDDRKSLQYSITYEGDEIKPRKQWVWSKIRLEQAIENNEIVFKLKKNGEYSVRAKVYLRDENGDIRKGKPITVMNGPFNQEGTNECEDLLGGKVFNFPKPISLIMRFLSFTINSLSSKNDIIVDFFSGSATTAHAVMQLNAEDGGNRRHIMVQLPEACDEKSEAYKAGYKTITEIGKERIRRAGKKILEEWQAKQFKEQPKQGDLLAPLSPIADPPSPPDIGFRVLKIDSSNMADVYYQPDELTQDGLMLQVDNLKPGRNPEDLLFQVLLGWGVDLALPISEETILKQRVFFVAENALAACFDTGLDEAFVKELAKRQPLRAVFRDSGYASDSVKINFEQIFKALSPHTELKTL